MNTERAKKANMVDDRYNSTLQKLVALLHLVTKCWCGDSSFSVGSHYASSMRMAFIQTGARENVAGEISL